MLTEDLGICPKCGYEKTLIRYGSWGYYKLDACPRCTFAFAHNDAEIVDKGKDVWDVILEVYSKMMKDEGFEISIDGFKQYMELNKIDDKRGITQVWMYTPENLIDQEYFVLPMDEVEKIVRMG